jgi:hypothetical protein
MDIIERLREYNEPPFDYIAHEAAAEIEKLRRIICNLLDDGDETDRAAARAALKGDE